MRDLRWPSIGRVLLLAAVGAVAGMLAKAADESTISWASDLGTYPAVWILALALIARWSPGLGVAAVRGVAFFVAMCLGYYAWSTWVLGFGGGSFLVLWGGLSVTAVPVLAAVTAWASRAAGLVPGAALALLGGLALSDGVLSAFVYRALGELPADFPYRPVQTVANVAVALVVVLAVPRVRSTRLWAAALLLPMGLVGAFVADAVLGSLLGLFG